MGRFQLRHSVKPRNLVAARLMGKLKMANLMAMEEGKYEAFVREIEKDPLFQRLASPQDGSRRLVTRRRFPGTDISSGCLELKEDISVQSGSSDIKALVDKRAGAVSAIRKMGVENFKKRFLYDEAGLSRDEAARLCGVTPEESARVRAFLDDFAIEEEFFQRVPGGDGLPPEVRTRARRIASIEKEGGKLVVRYSTPSGAKGVYSIDYQGLEDFRRREDIPARDLKRLDSLLLKLEMINSRKTVMNRVLECLVGRQREFLECGDRAKLTPFTQKELAGQIGSEPSSVCRAISGRCVRIPDGREAALKDLLPSRKMIALGLLEELLRAEDGLTDEGARDILGNRFGLQLSRRSITQYRHDLKIPSRRKARAR